MNFLADTHIHTLASGHAYSTIDEVLREASRKGTELIAITDHTSGMPGGAHDFYFMNLRILPKEMYGVKILTGAEVNIIDYEGNIDASQELMRAVDMVIASLHPPCIDFSDEQTLTKCIEKVMENPLINIIGHPGDTRYPLDFERIVKKAKATGTLLEVNNASLKPDSFRPGVRESLVTMLGYCKQYDTEVVVGSDAHIFFEVGELSESYNLLKELDFPAELVMNTNSDRLVSFISEKRLK
ncbi:MAG: phosphatase [Clostridia bacterium]|nr:phosphatase [Clostridia bacterium]